MLALGCLESVTVALCMGTSTLQSQDCGEESVERWAESTQPMAGVTVSSFQKPGVS